MGKNLLTLGAGVNFAIAFVHLIIIVVGAPAFLFFGSADFALLAAQGSMVPAILTFFLAIVFAGFGVYALSGAGIVRPLPLEQIPL